MTTTTTTTAPTTTVTLVTLGSVARGHIIHQLGGTFLCSSHLVLTLGDGILAAGALVQILFIFGGKAVLVGALRLAAMTADAGDALGGGSWRLSRLVFALGGHDGGDGFLDLLHCACELSDWLDAAKLGIWD